MIRQGNLRDFSLPDLVQILAQAHETGRLVLRSAAGDGEVFFAHGHPSHASYREERGPEAFYHLLTWGAGDFAFEPGVISPATTVNQTVDDLVKEGLARMDRWLAWSKRMAGIGPDSVVSWEGGPVDPAWSPACRMLAEGLRSSPEGIALQSLLFAADGAAALDWLEAQIEGGTIRVSRSPSVELVGLFETAISTLYDRFTAISGLKLSEELDRRLRDLIELKQWPLLWRDGKISDEHALSRDHGEQLDLYQAVWREVCGFVRPIYGAEWMAQTIEGVAMPTSPAAQKLYRSFLREAGVLQEE